MKRFAVASFVLVFAFAWGAGIAALLAPGFGPAADGSMRAAITRELGPTGLRGWLLTDCATDRLNLTG